jgi:hypothetical protein
MVQTRPFREPFQGLKLLSSCIMKLAQARKINAADQLQGIVMIV